MPDTGKESKAILQQLIAFIDKKLYSQALELSQICTTSKLLKQKDITNFANYMLNKGLFHEATITLRTAAGVYGKNTEILTSLAVALRNIGRLDETLRIIDITLGIQPNPTVLRVLAKILQQRNQPQKAKNALIKAIEINTKEPISYLELSMLLKQSGDIKSAVSTLNTGIKNTDGNYDLLIALGNTLYELGDYKNAEKVYSDALQKYPDAVQALTNLGVIKKELKQYDKAESLYKQAIKQNSKDAAAYNNLGVLYKTTKQFKKAISALKKAILLNPRHADAYSNIGAVLKETNKPSWAEKYYRKALTLKPGHINANLDYGIIRMLRGDYKEGMPHYEYRLRMKELASKYAGLKKDAWCKKGEDLNSKRILVFGEQGFGDVLQFVRYLPLLKERGAEVIFRTRPELRSLIEDSGIADKVILENETIDYDCHVALLSLPLYLGIDPSEQTCVTPYLKTAKPLYQKQSSKRIVFAFSGSPTHKAHNERFIDPEHFRFLTELDDTEILSLQMGEDREKLKVCDFYGKLTDPVDTIKDFGDSAAILQTADLLITSDTSVAHLGGALGIPAWVLLPANPDWRWGRNGKNTFWYPNVRLFRQTCRYRWEDVFQELQKTIEEKF